MKINIPLNYTIKTDRLLLRSPSKDDIPFIFKATRHDGFNDGMLWDPPKNIEELNEPFFRNITSWKDGKSFTFSIDLKDSKDFVGRISIRKAGDDNTFSIGFFTIPEFYGNGYMSEALEGVLDFGFNTLKANKIEACHAPWNVGSRKVLEKNGMKFVRHIEKGYRKKGEWIAEDLLAISKECFYQKR